MIYYKEWDDIQKLYYGFHRSNGRGANMLPFATSHVSHYTEKYALLKGFHENIYPFAFVKAGYNAVMVGVHDGFIDLGFSGFFIITSLIGNSGHAYALDVDNRNIDAINKYKAENQITNVTAIHKGAWNSRADIDFLFFNDFTSSNMPLATANTKKRTLQKIWGPSRVENNSFKTRVEVDKLDNILRDHNVDKQINFLLVTVNGVEKEVFEGASELIASPHMKCIAFPFRYNAMQHLIDAGFKIAVAEAHTKAWDPSPFYFACAVRAEEETLLRRGFKPTEIEPDTEAPCGFQFVGK